MRPATNVIAAVVLAACSVPPPATPPRQGAVARGCPAGAARLAMRRPDRGPFASLEALCAAHLASGGNDAPRICEPDVRARSHEPRLAHVAGSAFHAARIVEQDRGGDFVSCDLAVRTSRGWWGFDGLVCDNSMNDDAYAFTVSDLRRFARHDGSDGLVVTVTAVDGEGDSAIGGTFSWLCRVGAAGEPACRFLPRQAGTAEVIDFATRLAPGGILEIGALSARDASGIPLDLEDDESGAPSFTFMNGPSTRELLSQHRPGRYCL
ncbi:MAG: hypothetical protein HYY06_06490 [Deltaproteobacteria bacterium]|nr:hypothetical protein [Deltaproteobacteria bacterium]